MVYNNNNTNTTILYIHIYYIIHNKDNCACNIRKVNVLHAADKFHLSQDVSGMRTRNGTKQNSDSNII